LAQVFYAPDAHPASQRCWSTKGRHSMHCIQRFQTTTSF